MDISWLGPSVTVVGVVSMWYQNRQAHAKRDGVQEQRIDTLEVRANAHSRKFDEIRNELTEHGKDIAALKAGSRYRTSNG